MPSTITKSSAWMGVSGSSTSSHADSSTYPSRSACVIPILRARDRNPTVETGSSLGTSLPYSSRSPSSCWEITRTGWTRRSARLIGSSSPRMHGLLQHIAGLGDELPHADRIPSRRLISPAQLIPCLGADPPCHPRLWWMPEVDQVSVAAPRTTVQAVQSDAVRLVLLTP